MHRLTVRRGQSALPSAADAVRDLAGQIGQEDAALALVFVGAGYDLQVVGRALREAFACPVLACTTAGEIGPQGYCHGTLLGVTLSSDEIQVRTAFLPSLRDFVTHGRAEPAWAASAARDARRFALVLLDGMSMLEDQVIALLQGQCDGIPVVGGSAGDHLRFQASAVYHDGAFHTGAGMVAVVETTLPFTTFMVQHFKPTSGRLAITAATPETRCVQEIFGAPAATEYARLIGVSREALTPAVFAANPVMLRVGGQYYVRSIQRANPDDSLTFYCAIDNGLVLTLAQPTDLAASLESVLASVRAQMPDLALLVGFDCVLRRLELERTASSDRLGHILSDYPFAGFSTYGEQLNGLHMNHTLTGLALGGRA